MSVCGHELGVDPKAPPFLPPVIATLPLLNVCQLLSVCVRSYTAAVREDADVGSPLLKLTAVDRDEGDNGRVQFILCNQSASELVTVSSNTGWLSTAATLDYETTRQVYLYGTVLGASFCRSVVMPVPRRQSHRRPGLATPSSVGAIP